MCSHGEKQINQYTKVTSHVQNKSSTGDRMDFEKKMGQEMNMILDFMGNTCKHNIIKCTEWNLQKRVRIGFVFGMTRLCDEVILLMICYPIMKNLITILNTYIMIFTNGNAFSFMCETLRCVFSYTIKRILICIWILWVCKIN